MLDPSQALQVFFLLASSTILFLNYFPYVRSRFVAYGPRATLAKASNPRRGDSLGDKRAVLLNKTVSSVQSIQVPHWYFLHFYIVSVVSSLFWAIQILLRGPALRILIEHEPTGRQRAMPMDRIVVAWVLMSAQGIRRLSESLILTKPSGSKMWFVHWVLGIVFYIAMGLATWIEGAETLRSTNAAWSDLTLSAPSLRTILCIPLFLLASGIQHDCHAYLASLPKYTTPTHSIFQSLICPHYTMECLIYLSLAFIAAPESAWLNRTIFCALVFVSVNLGVTASTSKEWYEKKFGKEKVAGRWKMVPFIF